MHEPTQAALLRGIIGALEGDVLPAVDGGAPQRQLKAALVVLRRLARSADAESRYLEEEAADIARSLLRVLDDDRSAIGSGLRHRLSVAAAQVVGPDLEAARARDSELQQLVIDAEDHLDATQDREGLRTLRRLQVRMLGRQSAAWGTRAPAA